MKNTRIGDSIYHTTRWRKLRRYYYGKQHGLCERCGMPGSIVHHKIHLTPDNVDDIEIAFGEENLELLCQTCHNQEHYKEENAVRDDVTFDENGELIPKIKF